MYNFDKFNVKCLNLNNIYTHKHIHVYMWACVF